MAATHIGLVEDTPARTLSALKTSDLLIFEEDRPARLLLKSAEITRNYLKFNEHNSKDVLELLKACLLEAKTAVYVSDQGSPTLADPGDKLLELAYKLGARVTVIPGPSSITAAISACPFPMKQFLYQGFLAQDPQEREQALARLVFCKHPVIILDTPYRLAALLQSCAKVLGQRRKIFLACDLTGKEEQFFLGSIAKIVEETRELGKKNFVLIISAAA